MSSSLPLLLILLFVLHWYKNQDIAKLKERRMGPVAPSWFSSELDQVGRRELVHDDYAVEPVQLIPSLNFDGAIDPKHSSR